MEARKSSDISVIILFKVFHASSGLGITMLVGTQDPNHHAGLFCLILMLLSTCEIIREKETKDEQH